MIQNKKIESTNDSPLYSEEELNENYENESKPLNSRISKNKKRKFDASEFLNQEAEEEDDDDYNYDYEEEKENDLIIDEAEDNFDVFLKPEDQLNLCRNREIDEKYREDEVDLKELARYFKRKYAHKSSSSNLNNLPEFIHKNNLLPTLNDPKLWLIKCKAGKEKECACEIWNNYFNLKRAGQEEASNIEIKSVLVKENIRGYIYIEANKLSHVKKVIEKIKFIFHDKSYPKMVPLDEMVDVLKVTKSKNEQEVAAGCLVRLKTGLYKNDLAQVLYVDST